MDVGEVPGMNAQNTLLHRFYWTARRDYHLPAGRAIEYAHNRYALWVSELHWSVEPDEHHYDSDFGPLRVIVFDDDGQVLDSLGGIDETDDNHPYVVQLAIDMMAGLETAAA
jgi:hypothetical protein